MWSGEGVSDKETGGLQKSCIVSLSCQEAVEIYAAFAWIMSTKTSQIVADGRHDGLAIMAVERFLMLMSPRSINCAATISKML